MPDPAEYDDEKAQLYYAWEYGRELLTSFELEARRAFEWQTMYEAAEKGDGLSTMLRMKARLDDPELADVWRKGKDAFKKRVARSILSGERGPFYVNRCSRCERIVRTPRAQQCPWCYHRWHDSKDAPRDAQS
jgi:hypothetical protein